MARKTHSTNSQKWKKVKVGSRIAVYWDKDHRCYYACKVLRKSSESSPKRSHFFVEYEDGSRDWHDLAVEKFRLLEDIETYLDDEAEEDAAGTSVDVEDGHDSDGTPHIMSENDEEDENQNEEDDKESDDASVSATNSTANEDRKGAAALTNHSAKENDDGNQDQQGSGESHGDDEDSEADFKKVKRKSTTDASSKRRLKEEVDEEEEDDDDENQDQDQEAKNDENDDEDSTSFTEKNIHGSGSSNKRHEEVVEPTNDSAKRDDNSDKNDDDKNNQDQEKTSHLKNQEEDSDGAPERKTTADTSAKKKREGITENSKDFEMEDKVDRDQEKGAKDDGTGNEKEDEDSKPRLVNTSKQNSLKTKSPQKKDSVPQAYTKDPAERGEKDRGREAIGSGSDDSIASNQSKEKAKAKGKNVANASAKKKRKEPPDTTKDEDRGQEAKDDNDESEDGPSSRQPKKKVKGNTATSPSRKKKRKGPPVTTHADEDDKEMDDEDVKNEVRKENEHVIPQAKDKVKDILPQVKDKVQGDTSTSDTSMSTKRPSPKKKRKGDVESNKGASREEEGGSEEGREPIKQEGDDTEVIQDGFKDSTNQPKNGASDLSEKEKEDSEPNRSSFLLSRKSTVEDIENVCEQKKVSKEDALLSVMMIHYMAGTTAMTFDKLAEDLGYHSKSKELVQAWNTIRKQNLVEEEGNGRSKRKLFQLTRDGIDRVAPEDYDHNDRPTATHELHERIKGCALNEHGVTMFEELARVRKEGGSLTLKELGVACGVASTTKIFSLAFQQLKDDGYIISDSKNTSKFTLAEKCFLD